MKHQDAWCLQSVFVNSQAKKSNSEKLFQKIRFNMSIKKELPNEMLYEEERKSAKLKLKSFQD